MRLQGAGAFLQATSRGVELPRRGAVAVIIRAQAREVVRRLEELDMLAAEIAEAVAEHPITGLVEDARGLGPVVLANLLAEIGDDPTRFRNRRGFLAYLAVIPFTEQSGGSRRDKRRRTAGNNAHKAMWDWGRAVVLHTPAAEAYYWRRREAGDYHPTAIRKVAERLGSAFWHVWSTGEMWDDTALWEPLAEDFDLEAYKTKVKEVTQARKSVKAVNHGVTGRRGTVDAA